MQSKTAYAIMPVGKEKLVVHVGWLQRKAPVFQHWGFSIPFSERQGLEPQAGYRLFIAVQPFDDVMANYTSRNSDNKRG